jgi:carbamoyl-phosphate synthase large subunit
MLADEFVVVRRSDDPAFYQEFVEICERLGVDVVIPTHSSEIAIFGACSDDLTGRGISTFLVKPEIAELCDNKIEMDKTVSELGLRVPKQVDGSLRDGFPFFARQTRGSGSTAAQVVTSESDLEALENSDRDFQYSELITGVEYTVDVLALSDSTLAVCSPRERIEVRSGQTVRGVTVDMPELVEGSQRICSGIGFVGPGNIQFMVDDSGPAFIEFNPRFAAGGLGLTIAAGGNIPLMTLKLALGQEVSSATMRSGVKLTRYYRDVITMPEDSN